MADSAPLRSSEGQETVKTGAISASAFHTLHLAYRSHFGISLFLLLLGLLGRILLLSNANLIGYWIDSFCKAGQASCRPAPPWARDWTAPQFQTALILLALSGFALTLIYRIGFSRISCRAVSTVYDEATLRTSRFPISFFDQNPAGRVITRFSSDYSTLFRLLGGPLTEFTSITFDLIGMVLLISLASPYYLIICVGIGFLNYAVYRLNRPALRRERRTVAALRSPSIAHFAETVQGASTIRTFAKQEPFFERFARLNSDYLRQRLRAAGFVVGFSFQMNALTALLLLLTGFTGYTLIQAGKVSVGSIGVAFTFITLSGATLQMFFEWLGQFEEAFASLERLDQYLRHEMETGLKLPAHSLFETGHPRESAPGRGLQDSGGKAEAASVSISVKDLCFRYAPSLPQVLKSVSFEIQPGEHVGIVGRTGSGKSSLIQALFRLYPLESGRIEIDGRTAEQMDLTEYRRRIAFIPQEPGIFKGTLRQNLSLHSRRARDLLDTEPRMLEVLDRVGLRSQVNGHPLGLDQPIEERGRNLSLGERQLVCMARCLLQRAPLIVMDEATSAVDPQSEEIMVRATDEFFKEKTQIIIAHRLSTLEHCDRILWLQNGVIQMADTPERVLARFRKSDLSAIIS
ncbi:MAG: ABC transporter ATP-binding protein [Methylotenera sp.]|nr:ABC transporter ATP-binding protein [Oligoflexia bacterium]